MRKIFFFLSVAVLLFSGCSERIGDFTLISTKNVEIGGKYILVEGIFKGEDSKGDIIGIPLGFPSVKTAVDRCIEAGKGELLSNAVIENSYWSAIIWGERKFTVTGLVWRKTSISDLMDSSQSIFELKEVSGGVALISSNNQSSVIKIDYLKN